MANVNNRNRFTADLYGVVVKDRFREDLEEDDFERQRGGPNSYTGDVNGVRMRLQYSTEPIYTHDDYLSEMNDSLQSAELVGCTVVRESGGDFNRLHSHLSSEAFAENMLEANCAAELLHHYFDDQHGYFNNTGAVANEKRLRAIAVWTPALFIILEDADREYTGEGEVILYIRLEIGDGVAE
jgi:hypothetical protein